MQSEQDWSLEHLHRSRAMLSKTGDLLNEIFGKPSYNGQVNFGDLYVSY